MCVHMCVSSDKLRPASLRHAKQSLPLLPAGSRLRRGFRFPFRENDGVAATRLHSRVRLRALPQTRAPGVDPSTSEFSEFPAYWRVKLDSRSQLPACGKPLGAGSGGYGAQRIKKGDCGCREIYSSNTDFVVAKFRLGICIWKFFMKVLILTT